MPSRQVRPLRLGIVGLGWFGRQHLQAWLAIDGVEVIAVCDRDPQALDLQGEGLAQDAFHRDVAHDSAGIPPHVTRWEDPAPMLDSCDLDLLDVAVPEADHFDVARQGLLAGAHVVVEKPFVLDPPSARALVDHARAADRQIYVGQILRFDSRFSALREHLRAEAAALRHLSFQRSFQPAAHSVYGRAHPFFAGAIHDIDLALWLAGAPCRRVQGWTHSWLEHEHPDIAVGVLEWPDGLRAVLQSVWHLDPSCPYGFEFETKVFADNGTYLIRNEPVLQVWAHGGVSFPELFFWPYLGGRPRGALIAELTHFARCAAAGAPSPVVPIDEVLSGIAIADSLVRSAERGTWQEVGHDHG